MQSITDAIAEKGPVHKGIPTGSAVFKEGVILEMVHDPDAKKTRFDTKCLYR